MITVQELQHKSIQEIIRILDVRVDGYASADLKKLAYALDVSALSYNFDALTRGGVKLLCTFVTNEKGRSCIFYNEELSKEECRIIVTKAFARYILTGNKSFSIAPSTTFSKQEKRLVYELLMPKEEIHDVMYRLILPTTLNLANIFDVTQEFVRERLDEIRQSLPRMIAGYDF